MVCSKRKAQITVGLGYNQNIFKMIYLSSNLYTPFYVTVTFLCGINAASTRSLRSPLTKDDTTTK